MAKQTISRRVVFQAKCSCGWTGPERDAKYVTQFDAAGHNVDRHGGAERIGAES